MNDSSNSQLNAKILLFGEHSLMLNSMALSIPFARFGGTLVIDNDFDSNLIHRSSNAEIRKFAAYLSDIYSKEEQLFTFTIEQLLVDLESGLYFDSNIPQGYGLGSSGALIAALFIEYGERINPEDYPKDSYMDNLKKYFGILESYFHGKSSGLDPLISYLNKPVLITGKGRMESPFLDMHSATGKGAIFLIDSEQTGDTEPLVSHFRALYEQPGFKTFIDEKYIPAVNTSIENFISGNTDELLDSLQRLSAFQMDKLSWMIPETMYEIWTRGLATGDYYLKICGSGGGGMMLGFTGDYENALTKLSQHKLILVHQL